MLTMVPIVDVHAGDILAGESCGLPASALVLSVAPTTDGVRLSILTAWHLADLADDLPDGTSLPIHDELISFPTGTEVARLSESEV